MDVLSFIASILGSIAWPITVIMLAIIFRRSLAKILESIRLRKIKRGDLELDFDQELNQLKTKVEIAPIPPARRQLLVAQGDQKKQLLLPLDEQLDMISQINPAAGIALAWSSVERELQGAVERLAISPDYPAYNSAIRNIQLLHETKIIPDNIAETLTTMRLLRNQAVHELSESDSGLSIKEVEQYNVLARKVLAILSAIERKKE